MVYSMPQIPMQSKVDAVAANSESICMMRLHSRWIVKQVEVRPNLISVSRGYLKGARRVLWHKARETRLWLKPCNTERVGLR
jgi:hypothetical protein